MNQNNNKQQITKFFTNLKAKVSYSGEKQTMYVKGKDLENQFIKKFGRHYILKFKIVYL